MCYFSPYKGGSRVLGKGGGEPKASGCDALGVAGGWFGGGVPPPELEQNWNKEDFRRKLVTHGSQIYLIELQFCCLLNSQVGIIQVSMFLSIHHVLINLQVLLSQYLHVQGVKSTRSHKSIVHRVMNSYMWYIWTNKSKYFFLKIIMPNS